MASLRLAMGREEGAVAARKRSRERGSRLYTDLLRHNFSGTTVDFCPERSYIIAQESMTTIPATGAR